MSERTAPAPVRVEAERRFPVSVKEGFDYITDPRNWPEYWPGLIRLDPGSRWQRPGDRVRLVLRLLGRPVELEMTLRRLVPYQLVEYTSMQRGLPDACHRRHFTEAGEGFEYRLGVELARRRGIRGAWDRLVVAPATARALRRTLGNLDHRFSSAASES